MPLNGEASGTMDKGFTIKPPRGWLHKDDIIMKEGVTFEVRYIGCLEIKTSMKILDFASRSQVAKECINRVCEAAGLKSLKKRRVDKKILQCITDKPKMENAGTNVTLTVSSRYLSLVSSESGEIIAKHDMPRISFASGGDSDSLDFAAYVAKDLEDWRACYVLECGGGQVQDLISTIGQAFELRYNEFFVKPHSSMTNKEIKRDIDYYNDLPDKMPPDLMCENFLANSISQININRPRERTSSNLIDLNSPAPGHDYVNDKNQSDSSKSSNMSVTQPQSANQIRDVFDMQPFSLSAEVQRSQLMTETWFHGSISRPTAENLLQKDGDFLVRESQGTPGKYVLTGLQSSSVKHLLLIDPVGVVRTKDRIFDSISHLINYYWMNSLPIVSSESSLLLRRPISTLDDKKLTNSVKDINLLT